MTDQLKTTSSDTPVNGLQDKVEAGSDKVLSSLDGIATKVFAKGKSVIDAIFPPEKRAAFLARLQDFMLRNPKLSASLSRPSFVLCNDGNR